jgi:putative copper resistance protein D
MAIRAAHFAATAVTAGVLAFVVLIAAPSGIGALPKGAIFERQWRRMAWIALVIAIVTGVLWVLAEIVAMTERSLADAMADGLISIILFKTNFGLVSDVRLVLSLALAAALVGAETGSPSAQWIALILAAALLASLAWIGHAVGTPGTSGHVHVIGDALHLLAAGAWGGGLLPLGMVLTSAGNGDDAVYPITRRFSTMGMASVGTLIVTGFVNVWILVGSWRALTDTNYGRLLMVKLVLFAAMLALAALNRFVLMPRLAHKTDTGSVQRKLARNSMIELGLGLLIFAAVGVLGELHPAIHMEPP